MADTSSPINLAIACGLLIALMMLSNKEPSANKNRERLVNLNACRNLLLLGSNKLLKILFRVGFSFLTGSTSSVDSVIGTSSFPVSAFVSASSVLVSG